jgi:hypothetical protein
MPFPVHAGLAGRFVVRFVVAERIAVDNDHVRTIICKIPQHTADLRAAE